MQIQSPWTVKNVKSHTELRAVSGKAKILLPRELKAFLSQNPQYLLDSEKSSKNNSPFLWKGVDSDGDFYTIPVCSFEVYFFSTKETYLVTVRTCDADSYMTHLARPYDKNQILQLKSMLAEGNSFYVLHDYKHEPSATKSITIKMLVLVALIALITVVKIFTQK